MSDANRFQRLGQRFQQGGQELIKQNIDQPLDQMRMEQQVAPTARPQGSLSNPNFQAALPINAPEVPMQPGASPEFDQSQVSGLEAYQRLIERDKAQRQQMEMADAARKQQAMEDARAEYKPFQQEQGALTQQDIGKFQRLKERLAPQQGAIELSQDPEEMQRQILKARLGQ